MAVIEIARTTPLDKAVEVEALGGVAFTGERLAHRFIISGKKSNQPVQFSGSVLAHVIRSNDSMVIINGSIQSGKAVITLSPECYLIPGTISIVINVIEDNVTTCVYGAVLTVRRADSDTIVDSEGIIPSIDELLSRIEEMKTATTAANNAASAANTAANTANAAASNADSKASAANTAASAANTAAGKANTAANNADSKASAADTAANAANTAASTANTAATNANSKASLANTAAENADAKADAADSAAKAANTAKTNADTAAASANSAAAAANTAKENADTATAAANEATEESRLRTQEARVALADMADAISDAQDATDDALDAADAANAAKQAADTATTNAETATTAANTATARANTAAGKLENITADSETLAPASQSTASVSEVNGHYHVHFGIPEGLKGDTGDDASISSQNTQYQNSTSGTTIPSGEWLNTQPNTPQGQYLWVRVTLNWNNGENTVLYSVSRMGIDGSGSVSSVNGIAPNQQGNVVMHATDVPVSTTDTRTVAEAIAEHDVGVKTVNSISPVSGNVSMSGADIPVSGTDSRTVSAAIAANAAAAEGSVKTVNLTQPDAQGNVALDGTDLNVSDTDTRTIAAAVAENSSAIAANATAISDLSTATQQAIDDLDAAAVKSVNSATPDAQGDVALTGAGIPVSPTDTTKIDSALGAINTALAGKAESSSLATVATSGRYSDLSGTPSVATTSANGLMSSGDKTVVERIKNVNSNLAIVANGNTAPSAIAAGQYVIWGGALYTARSAISSGATLSTSNLAAVSHGGLNALKSSVDSLNSKINNFGEIPTGNKNADTIAVANNTGTLVSSIVLTKGIWIIVGCADWQANEQGYRQIAFTSDGINPTRNMASTASGISGKEAYQQIILIRQTNGETINMYARQTSGGNLNIYPYLYAVKVGNN